MSDSSKPNKRGFRQRLTYANVVSSLALFLALGGVSWAAATLPKNSVGSKQLKRNAVTTAKVKNYAITSSKIKKGTIDSASIKTGSITGDRLDLATLGKVPSATTADSVTNEFGPIAKRVTSSASAASENAARAAASEVPLATIGQITVYGKCFVDSTANVLYGEILARTSADGAAAISTWDPHFGSPSFLNTTTTEDVRRVYEASVANNDANYSTDSIGLIIGPDGNGFRISSAIWVKHGAIAGTSPLVTSTDQCLFYVHGDKFAVS